jgi:crotonobetainyl-CoA:carnitine CoA-transferase CaiB-like acyl-CoA transferase
MSATAFPEGVAPTAPEQHSTSGSCSGLRVVELVAGTSELGLGLAGGVPGMVLAQLGAEVVRVIGEDPAPIDADVPWGRVWHRDKRIVTGDGRAELAAADVVLAYGPAGLVEDRGFGRAELTAADPALVHVRCTGEYALLTEAAAGFCTQLEGHRPGPIFIDAMASGIGTASLVLASTFALLQRRARTGRGGWAETSLYDGMLATLGCMIGRSERAAAHIESYWEKGSTFPNFMYRCADGELVQVWFGGKGMYPALLDVLGDEPSEEGYYADQTAGRLRERAERWVEMFARRPRAEWVERLRAVGVPCEPVCEPGEVLAEPHAAEVGLAVSGERDGHRDVLVGSPIIVRGREPAPAGPVAADGPARGWTAAGEGLLSGLRVVDFSAFVAGPLAAQVLADLGADVVKVEPPQGEAMRAAAYAVAACQRGKRSIAMDIGAPAARPVVERLLAGADVVLHNFRVGVAERLGIDEHTVARLNPTAVYCHASAFGTAGPRARFSANDALMEAVTGFERAIGGAGNEPIGATWIPIDVAGGWLAAVGALAGLHARAAGGGAQKVETSLLGAAMLIQSGVFVRDGEIVRGPAVDGDQTGYGPGYRLYRGADDRWFALVLPDPSAWRRLAERVADLPDEYAPVRGSEAAEAAEKALTEAFATAPAADWVARLRELDLPVQPVEPVDRDGFRRAVLDDPTNRELGRVVSYETADWGHFEQLGPLLRCGPAADGGPPLLLPRIGEHSTEILTELGFGRAQVEELLASGVIRQLDEGYAAGVRTLWEPNS